MAPMSVRTSRSSRALETGESQLWVLLIGVNRYGDSRLPDLAYSAADCQGLADAIATATQAFPQKILLVHHDAAPAAPTQIAVKASLAQIIAQAKPEDTVLLYFSGHGCLDDEQQQVFLCFADTDRNHLLQTGLSMRELLTGLSQCAARQQLVWLDACHSGGFSLRGARKEQSPQLADPTAQMMSLLRQRARQSQGFYALLSCDQSQQSWEFPELGHGVFSYYLMQGLRGAAADEQGVIEADNLYKYVYYQTLRYIDETNQQLRLINQQKRGRGNPQLFSEYPLQTPKRIVEGVGELVLGLRPTLTPQGTNRPALIIDGLGENTLSLALGKQLQTAGEFDVTYCPQPGQRWDEIPELVEARFWANLPVGDLPVATGLLYLRGQLSTENADRSIVLPNGVRLGQSWLRQILRRSHLPQQIVILDCPGTANLQEWIEDLQVDDQHGQCLIAGVAPAASPHLFTEILLETLRSPETETGFSAAGWIAQLQQRLVGSPVKLHTWLSHYRGVIELLPDERGGRAAKPSLDLGLCPYLALSAFTEADAPFFFGRERLIQQLLEPLSRQPFLAVVGASGSGKSSIVQAGLIARLRQGRDIPQSQQWRLCSCRPGPHPLTALAECLVDPGTAKEQHYQKQHIEGVLYQGIEGFVYWLRTQSQPMTVLLLDQFEELFTLAPAQDRQQLLTLLFGALDHAADRFKVVITLRTDFIAAGLEFVPLAQGLQSNSVLVPPMLSPQDYRQVILKPAEKVGLQVEPELVEVLLQDLSQGLGDLPLLEFVLTQIWEHRQPGLLTLQSYQQQVGGLKGALERKAQAVYDSLDPEAQACARWIFLSLTQLGEGTEDTRRRVSKQALLVPKYPPALVENTLQVLVEAKLVVMSGPQPGEASNDGEENNPVGAKGFTPSLHPLPLENSTLVSIHADLQTDLEYLKAETTVEVAHEILIRHWSTLRWWLEENRARLRSQRQIEQAAQQWHQHHQRSEYLLSGIRLDAAEDLYLHHTEELSAEVQRFIEACLAARAQAQQQAKHRLRRTQIALGIISVLGLFTLGFGGLAWQQRQQSVGHEIEALNTLAESQLSSHQSLEALTNSVRAGRQLQQLGSWGIGRQRYADLRAQTLITLQQVVSQTQERNRLEGHAETVNRARYSPDGQWIASASDDGTVRLWQANGTLQHVLEGPGERLTDVVFSPDSQQVVATSADGTVLFWSLMNGELQDSLSAHSDWVTQVSFSADGRFLATASRDQTVKLWDAQSRAPIATLSGHTGWVNALAFGPDSQQLASGGEDGTIKRWRVATGQEIQTLTGHRDRITSLVFSPEGQHLISASGDRTVRVWNLSENTVDVLEGHADQVNSVALSPAGNFLLSVGADQRLLLWQLSDGQLLQTLQGHSAAIQSVDFAPRAASPWKSPVGLSGQQLQFLSAGSDNTIHQWETILPNMQALETAVDPGFRLAYDSTTHQYAVGGWSGKIALLKTHPETRESIAANLSGHTDTVLAVAFSPKGKYLASGSEDRTVRLWQPDQKRPLQTLMGHTERVNSVSFNPTATQLASGSDDQTVRLWNLTDGSLLRTLEGHQDGITVVKFSPDGQWIASGSHDNTIIVWNLAGEQRYTLAGHELAIADLAFSPDGQWLASGSWDHTLKLWRVRDGHLERTLTEHSSGVTHVHFTEDGRTIVSQDSTGTVNVWDVQDGHLIKSLPQNELGWQTLIPGEEGEPLINVYPLLNILNEKNSLRPLLDQGCDHLQDFLATHFEPTEREELCPSP